MTLLYLEAYMNFKVRVKMITPLKQPSTTKPVEQPLDYFFFWGGRGIISILTHPPPPINTSLSLAGSITFPDQQ